MLAWLGAGIIASAGVIIIAIGLFTPVGAASFGWFAYQPLANATFLSGGSAVILSQLTLGGFIILAVGLIALAFLAGRVTGRAGCVHQTAPIFGLSSFHLSELCALLVRVAADRSEFSS